MQRADRSSQPRTLSKRGPASTRRQPQRVPPPLLSSLERVEGEGILDENPGDDGLVLWKTYRALHLWTQLKPEERREILSENAYAARVAHLEHAEGLKGIRAPLTGLAESLRKTPHSASLVARCRAIEEWADTKGAA